MENALGKIGDKLLSLKWDYVFKQIMGDPASADALADFLSAALDMPFDDFAELEVVNPELQRRFKGDKLVILDVKIAAGQIAKYTGLEIGEIEKL
ncbi:MAG: Rpn family recombination-promoting nuclease/putative transposase [Clostridiales Family XIII bacterium]|jgi:predicted transposase/invertase (TIGR01784 family)|nr:Rpn family recombination-promoting nuclease/putative transposase [Clostridiales Family XIII bacterium]